MGKGSSPRNCFSRNFKNNYDLINWGKICPECLGKKEKLDLSLKVWKPCPRCSKKTNE